MKTFEYLVEFLNIVGKSKEKIEEDLNRLGNDGWELVTVSPDSIYTFKRKKAGS